MEAKFIHLNNGIQMPSLGFGSAAIDGWQADSQKVEESIGFALEVGYRHIDTAAVYGNERSVGRAIGNADVQRKDIFLVSKVWNSDQGYDETLRAFDASLARLNQDYLDLYLVHWPISKLTRQTWKAMETLYEDKRVRAIGVSNFAQKDLEQLFAHAHTPPVCNQIELHPFFQQPELINFLKANTIATSCWSPLGSGDWNQTSIREEILNHPVITQLATDNQLSPAQLVLAWQINEGNITIPKSQTPAHIQSNYQAQFASLDTDCLKAIDALNQNTRIGPDPAFAEEMVITSPIN